MRVAILGVGTVGEAVVNILRKNAALIEARSGEKIEPVVGVVRDLTKRRNCDLELCTDMDSVLKRDDIDVYVELMGGVEYPYEIIKKILTRKKAVVTANKALLAYHRYALEKLSNGIPFGYEASVAGGIPIIKALREGLSANRIEKIAAILNGTSNYILTSMMQDGKEFDAVLKEAQELGFAEADPTFDVDGFDAAHKLLILSSIAYGVHGNPEDILIEGIRGIGKEDIYFAKEFGYVIKLLAISKIKNDKVELRVHPTLIANNNILAKVDGVMNGVSIYADAVGETMYYGAGAGGKATASAVVSDLIDVARGNKNPILGYKSTNQKVFLLSKDEIQTKYYIKVRVKDRVGVLAKITNLMSKNNLSIDSFLQKPKFSNDDSTTLFFTTHQSFERDINALFLELSKEDYITEKPYMIRIEE